MVSNRDILAMICLNWGWINEGKVAEKAILEAASSSSSNSEGPKQS